MRARWAGVGSSLPFISLARTRVHRCYTNVYVYVYRADPGATACLGCRPGLPPWGQCMLPTLPQCFLVVVPAPPLAAAADERGVCPRLLLLPHLRPGAADPPGGGGGGLRHWRDAGGACNTRNNVTPGSPCSGLRPGGAQLWLRAASRHALSVQLQLWQRLLHPIPGAAWFTFQCRLRGGRGLRDTAKQNGSPCTC